MYIFGTNSIASSVTSIEDVVVGSTYPIVSGVYVSGIMSYLDFSVGRSAAELGVRCGIYVREVSEVSGQWFTDYWLTAETDVVSFGGLDGLAMVDGWYYFNLALSGNYYLDEGEYTLACISQEDPLPTGHNVRTKVGSLGAIETVFQTYPIGSGQFPQYLPGEIIPDLTLSVYKSSIYALGHWA